MAESEESQRDLKAELNDLERALVDARNRLEMAEATAAHALSGNDPRDHQKAKCDQMVAAAMIDSAKSKVRNKKVEALSSPGAGVIAPVDVLRTFHRTNKGFIALAKKNEEGAVKPWAGLPVETIDEWFPEIVEEMSEEGYAMPNTVRRVGNVVKRTGYAYPIATKNNVQCLNAAFVDIDHYKLGVSQGAVLGATYDYADEGVIPWPSMWGFSGQGVWVFWLLRDELHPDFSPLADERKNREMYRAINTALVRRFENVGADATKIHRASWSRFPGTRHRKTGKRARYLPNIPIETGTMPVYTLPEMVDVLGLTFTPLPVRTAPLHLPGKRFDKSAAVSTIVEGGTRHRAPHRARVRELEMLNDMRGGFREGCREYALWVFACSLRSMGLQESDVHQRARVFASKFNPTLPAARVDHQVRRRAVVSRWRSAEIARRLNITPAEYALLDCLVPKPVKDARDQARAASWDQKQAERREQYQDWLRMCWTYSRQRGGAEFPRPVTEAAKRVGVNRRTIQRWEKEYSTFEWFGSARCEWFVSAMKRSYPVECDILDAIPLPSPLPVFTGQN